MPVTFNPQIVRSLTTSQNTPFKGDEIVTQSEIQAIANGDGLQVNDQQTDNKPKGILAKVAYAWINFSEGTKGILKGLFYGGLAGGVLYGGDKIVSRMKEKPVGKVGKILAPVVGAIILAYHIIMARLTANQRTANVDHMLYDGHRGEVE